jgi:hypothetical protein
MLIACITAAAVVALLFETLLPLLLPLLADVVELASRALL